MSPNFSNVAKALGYDVPLNTEGREQAFKLEAHLYNRLFTKGTADNDLASAIGIALDDGVRLDIVLAEACRMGEFALAEKCFDVKHLASDYKRNVNAAALGAASGGHFEKSLAYVVYMYARADMPIIGAASGSYSNKLHEYLDSSKHSHNSDLHSKVGQILEYNGNETLAKRMLKKAKQLKRTNNSRWAIAVGIVITAVSLGLFAAAINVAIPLVGLAIGVGIAAGAGITYKYFKNKADKLRVGEAFTHKGSPTSRDRRGRAPRKVRKATSTPEMSYSSSPSKSSGKSHELSQGASYSSDGESDDVLARGTSRRTSASNSR